MGIVFLIAGLVLLVAGAEILVRGASRLARGIGISPLVVGLTVVAFGTSAPEMAVSIGASLAGQADLALGNVVGSNIFNVLLILGLSALVAPLVVSRQLVRLDVPLMIAVSVLVLLMGIDGRISRLDGAILFAGILSYTAYLIHQGRRESREGRTAAQQTEPPDAVQTPPPPQTLSFLKNISLIVGGLALLVLGANWLVDSAIQIAQALGVSELIIGLTIVAAGTSMPELATSVIAGLRGERDIAVGNIVGSNIFNILAVLGLSALVSTDGVAVAREALSFDIPVMIGVALICLPIFFSGYLISRWNGALLLFYYLIYTTFLLMTAQQHPALQTLNTVMLGAVLPVTCVMLLLSAWRYQRSHRLPS